MSIFDLDNYTDAISDAIDAIGDAGDLIGDILKSISPILQAIPGIGTAFSVAVYAAGALAAKDEITEAMIGTASAAVPPGIPRIAFDGATKMTKDIAEGRDALGSALEACRQAADAAGGRPAVEAFESGIVAAQGGRIDARLIAQGRALAFQGGGSAAAASYDVGIAIAEGKGADRVIIDAARGYVSQMGGPLAISMFDTAVALSYGATLQKASYKALHTFVNGNNGIEKVLNFIEQVGMARLKGANLQALLAEDLAMDFYNALAQRGVNVDSAAIDEALAPYINAIEKDVNILNFPAGELAAEWPEGEAIVRAAQALMRNGAGSLDTVLLDTLKDYRPQPVLYDNKERNVTTNDGYAQKGRLIISGGARWKGRLLSDILAAASFTITHDALDGISLTQIVRKKETYDVNDVWKRGFTIAIGVCEGRREIDVEQQQVSSSLVPSAQKGFDAGQEVQFNRTNPLGLITRVVSPRDNTNKAQRFDIILPAVLDRRAQRQGMYMPKSVRVKELFEPQPRIQEKTTQKAGALVNGDGVAIDKPGPALADGAKTQPADNVVMDKKYPRVNK